MAINKPIERKTASYKELLAKTNLILERLHTSGDKQSARKVAELSRKITEENLTIAFCGHFSAGKSTFINEILQESLLPASPIPTSANVVKIQKGTEKARVYFFEGESLEILPPVSFENVKAYCKDGDKVESVAYQFPFKNLPDDLIVLDTPGVDSTDDAHRVSTESALHLADVIFYVMDYNHVQSEVNLKFIKELQDQEKRIYLVVNQIDKHREEEISFETYQKRIQDSFKDWGIEPVSLYFTSLKDPLHPLNDVNIVKETIQLLREDKMDILPITVENALHHILEEHRNWLFQEKLDTLDKLNLLVQESELAPDEVTRRLQVKKTEWAAMEAQVKKVKEDFIKQNNQLLENANITPFEMRELAGRYLESMQKGFKVGLLFSSKKTLEEQQKRLEAFIEDLAKRVKTQIEKFVHELVIDFLKDNDLYQAVLFEEVQNITVQIDSQLVATHVKQGAGTTGDAVLHYTKELAQTIKGSYRKQALSFMEKIFEQIDSLYKEKNENTLSEIKDLESLFLANEEIRSINRIIEEKMDQIQTILYHSQPTAVVASQDHSLMDRYVNRTYKQVNGSDLEKVMLQKEKPKNEKQVHIKQTVNDVEDPKEMAEILKKAAGYLHNLEGFQSVVQDLKNKQQKLDKQSFTVALFGAFSAGKSSFANALLGEYILPVSPNPTTASINKISPVTKECPHGTVSVQMKSRDQIFEDVHQALSVFNTSMQDLEDAKDIISAIIQKNEHLELDASKKPHFHFLKAFASGWDQMGPQLGSQLTVSLDEFPSYVADEEKSCFVEWIEVHYDCALTREGLTLVDTPGADSINARHTDVAFDYIKNADAILFVTYYQHAFSKADREFLIQLGRVKDAFSMDKMFFLVNAADLAQTREELTLVTDYVEEQLQMYGIRNPKLFPVSSLLALKEKEGKSFDHPFMESSMLGDFEDSFKGFIQSDLISMSIRSARLEIARAVALMENYLNEAKLGKEEKAERRAVYLQNKSQIQNWIADYSIDSFQTLLTKEIGELLYYVKHRTFLRFNDFFREAFNPSVLKEDGRNMKEQFSHSLREFHGDISHNLSQEVRATTVRIENYIKKSLQTWQNEVEGHAEKIEKQLSFSAFELDKLRDIKVENHFLSYSSKVEKQAIGYFRNSKAFFEKNEKQKLSDYLEEQTSPLMDHFSKENEKELDRHYQEELKNSFARVKADLDRQLEDFYRGMQAALSEEINTVDLEEVYHKVSELNRKEN
ncbi:dynamin family protein [Bacillus tianshenii]|uniref:dynamin family protein n=1 Tax=Sutcliffiella tianshenii TaxID=1463404 RepID=UPI001CD4F12F|nr:dynamin family protein [Bacillus tianshenii]MCA1321178.1 dynamin family protein [Bacillus tianshenii]